MTESIWQIWTSGHTALMICFGMCTYVVLLHMTLARQGHAANLWVALWAAATAVLQVAHFAQHHATASEPTTPMPASSF